MRAGAHEDRAQSWDQRLYPGLRVELVPGETRAALVQAAGALGVEAEHFLGAVRAFLAPPPGTPRSREMGERFLWQLEASAGRLRPAAASFELATQAYLTALEAGDPELRRTSSAAPDAAEPWWPLVEDDESQLASLDLCLRQCGFSYRQAVAARLTSNVEALAEQLSLLLHALGTLPPVGVVPLRALYAGLDELASTFQGHVVPHLLASTSPDKPGLVAGIQHLRELDAAGDRSIEADLAWAQEQLREVRQLGAQQAAAQPDAARRGGLAGLFRRAAPQPAAPTSGPRAWVDLAEREWRETISALESVRTQAAQASSTTRRR